MQTVGGERPLDVIYDGVGKDTMRRGFALLRPFGLMAAFCNASGAADPVDPLTLSTNGSLYLTRPTLFNHIATNEALTARAADGPVALQPARPEFETPSVPVRATECKRIGAHFVRRGAVARRAAFRG